MRLRWRRHEAVSFLSMSCNKAQHCLRPLAMQEFSPGAETALFHSVQQLGMRYLAAVISTSRKSQGCVLQPVVSRREVLVTQGCA